MAQFLDDDPAFRAALAFADDFDGALEPSPVSHVADAALLDQQQLRQIAEESGALQVDVADAVDLPELHVTLDNDWLEPLDASTPAATVYDGEIALDLDRSLETRYDDSMALGGPNPDPFANGRMDMGNHTHNESKESAERAAKRTKTATSSGGNANSRGCKPVRKHDPNKARNERKQELIFLKSKVVELELTLRALQLTSKNNNRSEVNEIEKCLDETHYRPESGHHAQVTGRVPDPSDAVGFDVLLAGVQRCYEEIDTVFAANGLARIETTYTDARMRRDRVNADSPNGSGLHLEIAATKLLPFDLEATNEAVWHHFVFGKETNPNRYYTEQTPKVFLPTISSYLKNFSLEVHDASGTSAEYRVKQVLRQYHDADRIVIVWQARLDAVAFCNSPLSVIHDGDGFFEKGYILLRRPQSSSLAAKGITVMQTCFNITPTFASGSRLGGAMSNGVAEGYADDEDGAQLSALTEFVLHATTANLRTSHQILENVLLEQSLAI
ncbi:hypothetical protein FI667_g11702, partial [Globisporangium splendens]